MASSSNALKPELLTEEEFNEEEFQKEIKDVEDATNPEDYEHKLDKIGSTVAKWMKLIFNKNYVKDDFEAVWLSVSCNIRP